jgi:hypothetical protein
MKRWIVPSIALLIAFAAGLTWWVRSSPSPVSRSEFAGLSIERQTEIWDAEHVTFEIETHVGGRIASAIKGFNRPLFETVLREDFRGRMVSMSSPVQARQQATVAETRYGPAGGDAAELESAPFSHALFDALTHFRTVDAARFRILNIQKAGASGAAAPRDDAWFLEVLLTASGTDAHLAQWDLESYGHVQCRFAGDQDIAEGRILTRWDVGDVTLRHSPLRLFEERTAAVGLDEIPIQDNWTTPLDLVRQYTAQSAVEDFDRDGDFDLAVSTADGECLLYRFESPGSGGEGRFVDVTTAAGIEQSFDNPERSYLAAWLDVDNDQYPELLLGTRLYRNLKGERFEPFPDNAGIRLAFNPMGTAIADYDCDGLVDLYVLYQRTAEGSATGTPAWVGDDQTGAENQLWRNVGDGRFEDATASAGAGGGRRHSFAACWLHANGDRYPDLYVANDFGTNTWLVNAGDGTFRNETSAAQIGDFSTSMGVAAGDINDDGQPEIYVANMYSKMGRRIIQYVCETDYPESIYEQIVGSCAGNRLYQLNPRTGVYEDRSDELGVNGVGWAYAPAFLDIDGDTDLDIYATTGFMSFTRGRPDG